MKSIFKHLAVALVCAIVLSVPFSAVGLTISKIYNSSEAWPKVSRLEFKLLGPEQISEDSYFSTDVHKRSAENSAKIKQVDLTIRYDKDKLQYAACEGGSVKEIKEGSLKVSAAGGSVFNSDYEAYSNRLLKLTFKSREPRRLIGLPKGHIRIIEARLYGEGGREIDFEPGIRGAELTVAIASANPSEDYNGDGLISIGDIAKAGEGEGTLHLREMAKKSRLYDYKRVLYFGFDGAGNGFGKVYNRAGRADIKKYKTPAMDEFLSGGAVSFSSQACMPSNSGNNWCAILHSINTYSVEEKYRVSNDSARSRYFPTDGKYKSLLKAAQQQMPARRTAAYAVWGPILDGILECDVAAEKVCTEAVEGDKDEALTDRIIAYIKSGKAKNTSVLFAVFNGADLVGHSSGWYSKKFYKELTAQDKNFERIMNALGEEKLLEDSLIIVNSDHGGWWRGHGGAQREATTTFIGVSGRTVSRGRLMKGGESRDIPVIAAEALGLEKDPGWQGRVFDEKMFLKQEELTGKLRGNAEKISIAREEGRASLIISELKDHCIKALDIQLSLGDKPVKVKDIRPQKGFKLLRAEEKGGSLRLILLVEGELVENSVAAALEFKPGEEAGAVTVERAAAGTDKGEEIFLNIDNGPQGTGDLKSIE